MKNNWQTKKLDDLCNIIGGGTPSKSNSFFYKGNIPWATVRDMKEEVISKTEFKITQEAVVKSATNIIPKGNVVIATRVGLGKVCLLQHDTAINQDLRGIIPKSTDELSISYLFWWLKSVSSIIVKNGTGATVQGVKLPFIKNLDISLPTLSEQQHIVDILDAIYINTKRLETIYKQRFGKLEQLKDSILQKAFNGELSKAKSLLKAHL